jgi:hypothetical protein
VPFDEPMLKRHNVVAARDAVADLWGAAALEDVLQRMPPSEREIVCSPMADWVPVRVPIELGFAVWEGPVARTKAEYHRYLHRHTDMTTGRVRKALLGLARPDIIFKRAPGIWRSEHTAGTLEATMEGASGIVVLRDHPYADSPQGRAAIAETFRYVIELTRAQRVTEMHALVGPSTVEVRLRWETGRGSP